MTYTVKGLDESTWDALAALVERNNGVFGGCWCMGFHPEGVGKETTAALNRRRKLERVRAGTAHAALVFDGDDCLGWCQFGAPGEVPRIKSRAAYEKGVTIPPDWRIACNFVGKGHRRQGVATAALKGALDLIAALGGGRVEGYRRAQTPFLPASCSTVLSRRTKSWASSATARSASTVGSSPRRSNGRCVGPAEHSRGRHLPGGGFFRVDFTADEQDRAEAYPTRQRRGGTCRELTLTFGDGTTNKATSPSPNRGC